MSRTVPDDDEVAALTRSVLHDKAGLVDVPPDAIAARVERARIRAARRPARQAAGAMALGVAVVVAATAALAGVGLLSGGRPNPGVSPSAPASVGSAASGTVQPTAPTARPTSSETAPASQPAGEAAALVRVYPVAPSLIAAGGGSGYGVLVPSSGSDATLVRIAPDGSLTRRKLADPLAPYFSGLAVDGSSIILGTNVVKRFTNAADELVRLDAASLEVVARATLPGGVTGGILTDGVHLWVALGDRVLRMDPASLSAKAAYVISAGGATSGGSGVVTSLALGQGVLWATYGSGDAAVLLRLDPVSLSPLGTTPLSGPEAVGAVTADADSTWLVGDTWVRSVAASGRLGDQVPLTSAVQSWSALGRGLLLVVASGATETLLVLDSTGMVLGRSDVGDAGARLAVDGRSVWLPHGLSLANWSLQGPKP